MATLTFEFQGILIHMTEFSPYRIIIPAGPVPTGFMLSPTVSPLLGALDGVTFTVGSGQPLSVQIKEVPHLSKLYPPMIVNPHAVTGQQQPSAAYFDFEGGAVAMATEANALYTKVSVEVDGNEAFIQVQRWNQPASTSIQVPLPQTITINNVPSPEVGAFAAAEYMGNFLIASNFPTGPALKKVEQAVAAALKPPASIGGCFTTAYASFPSCSNSQWP
jgi:hypothetical protein